MPPIQGHELIDAATENVRRRYRHLR